MHGNVEARAGSIGGSRSLVEGQRGIAIAKQDGRDATLIEFGTNAAGDGQRYIFFEQASAKGCAWIGPAMSRVHHDQEARRRGGLALRGRRLRGGCWSRRQSGRR